MKNNINFLIITLFTMIATNPIAASTITNATKIPLKITQKNITITIKPQASTPITSGIKSVAKIMPTTKSTKIKPLSNATVKAGQSYNINLNNNVLSLDATL